MVTYTVLTNHAGLRELRIKTKNSIEREGKTLSSLSEPNKIRSPTVKITQNGLVFTDNISFELNKMRSVKK